MIVTTSRFNHSVESNAGKELEDVLPPLVALHQETWEGVSPQQREQFSPKRSSISVKDTSLVAISSSDRQKCKRLNAATIVGRQIYITDLPELTDVWLRLARLAAIFY